MSTYISGWSCVPNTTQSSQDYHLCIVINLLLVLISVLKLTLYISMLHLLLDCRGRRSLLYAAFYTVVAHKSNFTF